MAPHQTRNRRLECTTHNRRRHYLFPCRQSGGDAVKADDEAKPEPNANGTADQDAVPLPQRFSENALAYLFTAEHPDLIYVHEWGKWLRYDAGRWTEDH